jgi:osmoprotectant transport system permease protein
MGPLEEVITWLADPAHWAGVNGVPARLVEHITLSAVTVVVGMAVALPLGLVIGHTGRGALLAINLANLGRAIPSYALLLVLFPVFGLGFATAFPALLLLTLPPILTNTYVGIREVDAEMVDAGRGMGMGPLQVLGRVEMPIALPFIVAGIRTAAVQVVATATLAALVAGGGLGRYIVDGFALQDDGQLLAGGLLVASVAIATERLLAAVERRVTSPGIRIAGPSAGSDSLRWQADAIR